MQLGSLETEVRMKGYDRKKFEYKSEQILKFESFKKVI